VIEDRVVHLMQSGGERRGDVEVTDLAVDLERDLSTVEPGWHESGDARGRSEHDARGHVANPHLRQLRLIDGKPGAFDGDAAAFYRPRRANAGHAGR
jgi:hypothetical protein